MGEQETVRVYFDPLTWRLYTEGKECMGSTERFEMTDIFEYVPVDRIGKYTHGRTLVQIKEKKKGASMKKLDKQKANIDQLLQLVKENPDLEIVPMVNYEVCASDDFSSWMGGWGKAEVEEVYHSDERIYFRSQDEDEIAEQIYDNLELGDPKWTEEDLCRITDEKLKEIPWEKVIVVNIGLP
ncbi:hypothetical protein P59_182 [Bacillus phage P59]|nr:hypothetical protein P59_182 [Bacillus phage P59]